MKEIKVTGTIKYEKDGWEYVEDVDHFIQVDDDIYPILKKYTWYMKPDRLGYSYAYTTIPGTKINTPLHAFVIGCAIKPNTTDHLDGNRDNSQLTNLMIVTQRQNSQNRFVDRDKLPGVFSNTQGKRNPYCSKITVNGKAIHLGVFTSPEAAFFAYKTKIEEIGEVILPATLERCYRIIDNQSVHI